MSRDLNFNVGGLQPKYEEQFSGGDFPPVPEGWYTVMIREVVNKSTKKNDGHYLEYMFEVADGEHKERRIWDRVNYDNASAKSREIAEKQLTNIGHATGVTQINMQTISHFVGRMLAVYVVVREEPGYKPKNEVTQYAPATGFAAGTQVAQPQTAAQPERATVPPPWAGQNKR